MRSEYSDFILSRLEHSFGCPSGFWSSESSVAAANCWPWSAVKPVRTHDGTPSIQIGEHVLVEQGSLRHGIRRRLRSHLPGAGDSSRLAIPDYTKHRLLPTGREGASAAKRRAQSTSQDFLTSSHDDSCTRAIARWDDAGRAALPGSGKTLWDALSSKVWGNLHEGEQHCVVHS
jgi:hypothetical protein